MIIKMEKVPFTTNNLIKGNGQGSLTAHVLYLIRDKNTKKYSPERSDLFFKINPFMADLGKKLKLDNKKMSEAEIENTVREYCQKQHDYIVEKYVKHSRKKKCLDDNNECLNTKGENSLYYLKGNCTLEMEEYQRILDHVKGDQKAAKKIIDEINNDFLAMYFNEVKKQRGIKGKKAKSSDIEKMSNFHIENEDNPHIHFFCHSFNPAKGGGGEWLNPMAFAYTKQKIHMALEKKYKQFLNQGIAIGAYKNYGQLAKKEYLAECINKGLNWKQTRKSFTKIKDEIEDAIKSNKSTVEIIKGLKAKGIHLDPKGKDPKGRYKMNIKIDGSEAMLNTSSFSNKNQKSFDTNIKKFMERVEFDQLTKTTHKSDKIQSVLEDILEQTKSKLERDLRASKPSEHKHIKQEYFKEFTKRALKAGIVVNLNKQGNLKYHKIDVNSYKNKDGIVDNNAKARGFKASIFQNPELQGKSLIDLFGLNEEDIFTHQKELFQLMPKTANYRDVVYFNTNLEEMNLVEKEYRIRKQYQNTFDYFNLEVKFDDFGDLFLFDKKTGEALIQKTYNDDNSSSIAINNLQPKIAAPILLSMLQEDARALQDNQKLVITKDSMSNDCDTLRHLEVDLMFSTDTNSRKIEVKYPNKDIDEKLEKMIDVRLEKDLERFNKNVQKFSNNKTKYTFTEASGVHLINNPNFFNHQDRIKEQFNNQIIQMITEKGITEIKFSNRDNYIQDNEKELIELASSLSNEKRKLVLEVIKNHKTEEPKKIKITPDQPNKAMKLIRNNI